MTPKEITNLHLRSVEAGEWDKALSYISQDYITTGVIPFPVSLFIKLRKAQALTMHKARKRALPDFKFNEEYQEIEGDRVKIQVNLTGTQTGTIDYTKELRGIPVIPPTNKFVKLNPEWFEYFVKNDQIYKVIADIPKNAGVKGLVRAVTE